jgi:hypothetical protein
MRMNFKLAAYLDEKLDHRVIDRVRLHYGQTDMSLKVQRWGKKEGFKNLSEVLPEITREQLEEFELTCQGSTPDLYIKPPPGWSLPEVGSSYTEGYLCQSEPTVAAWTPFADRCRVVEKPKPRKPEIGASNVTVTPSGKVEYMGRSYVDISEFEGYWLGETGNASDKIYNGRGCPICKCAIMDRRGADEHVEERTHKKNVVEMGNSLNEKRVAAGGSIGNNDEFPGTEEAILRSSSYGVFR